MKEPAHEGLALKRLGGLLIIGVSLLATGALYDISPATAKEMGDTMTGTPSAPRNPRITMNVPGRITVSWDASEMGNVQNYAVYRTEGSDMDFSKESPVIWTPGTQLFYDDYSVAENKKYNYKIAALNGSMESSNSAAVSATQELSVFVLSGYANSPTSLHLSWSAQTAAEGYTGYSLYRATGNGEYVKIWETATLAPAYYDDINLMPGTSYSYYVAAAKSDGSTRRTANSQFSTPVAPPPASNSSQSSSVLPNYTTPTSSTPGAAIQLTAFFVSSTFTSSTLVQLDWNYTTGTTGYTVYRRAAGSPNPEIISKISSGYFFKTSFVDALLTPGVSYSYYIEADKGGRSAEVTPVRIAQVTAPKLTGTLTSKIKGTLSWNAIPDAVSYTLFSRFKNEAPIPLYSGTQTTYDDVSLLFPDEPYTHFVIAYGADDRPSPRSNEVVLLGNSYITASQITITGMDNTRIRPGNTFRFRYSIKNAYLDGSSTRPYRGNFRIERSIVNPKGVTIVRASTIWNGKSSDTFTSAPAISPNSGWMKGDYKMTINVYALQEKGRFIDSKTVGFRVE